MPSEREIEAAEKALRRVEAGGIATFDELARAALEAAEGARDMTDTSAQAIALADTLEVDAFCGAHNSVNLALAEKSLEMQAATAIRALQATVSAQREEIEATLSCYRNAWVALRMIREAIEGESVGALPAGEHSGVTPTDEAEHIVSAILKMSADVARLREALEQGVVGRLRPMETFSEVDGEGVTRLVTKAHVHDGCVIVFYGTNDKPIGWLDTHAEFLGKVYRHHVIAPALTAIPEPSRRVERETIG